MKSTYYPLLILAMLAFAGCTAKPTVQPIAQPVVLRTTAAQKTALTDTGLKIELVSLEDSRCPRNVICIVAGTAVVKLKLSQGTDSADLTLEYTHELGPDKTSGKTLGCTITVTNVEPYPDTSQPPKFQTVTLQVEKD